MFIESPQSYQFDRFSLKSTQRLCTDLGVSRNSRVISIRSSLLFSMCFERCSKVCRVRVFCAAGPRPSRRLCSYFSHRPLSFGADTSRAACRRLLSFPNLRTLRLWDMTALAGPSIRRRNRCPGVVSFYNGRRDRNDRQIQRRL